MTKAIFIFYFWLAAGLVYGQNSVAPKYFNSTLALGTENNWGVPGVLYKNSISIPINKALFFTPSVTFFHSVPNWSADANLVHSAIFINTGVFHQIKFDEDKKYVLIGADFGVVHYANLGQRSNEMVFDIFGNPYEIFNFEKEEKTLFNYHLNVEGGGKISERVSIGLSLDIYSYQIFGDITTLGINARVRL